MTYSPSRVVENDLMPEEVPQAERIPASWLSPRGVPSMPSGSIDAVPGEGGMVAGHAPVAYQSGDRDSPSRRERLKRWNHWKEAVRREEGMEESGRKDGQCFNYQQYLQVGKDAAASHFHGAERIVEDASGTGLLKKPQEKICLERVLLAYMGCGNVSYVPQMSFVVAMLILVAGTNEEEEVFAVFRCLMEHYGLKEFCREGFPMAKSYSGACKHMVERKLPNLYAHLEKLGSEAGAALQDGCIFQHLCLSWFTTLFVVLFPPPVVQKIWDTILSKAPSEHGGLLDALRVSYFIFEILEPTLLRMKDLGEVQAYFKAMRRTSAGQDGLNHCWLDLSRQACTDVQIHEDVFSEVLEQKWSSMWHGYLAGTLIAVSLPACALAPYLPLSAFATATLPSAALVSTESAVSLWPLAAPIVVDLSATLRSASDRILAPWRELAEDAFETGSLVLFRMGLAVHRPAETEVAQRSRRQWLAILSTSSCCE